MNTLEQGAGLAAGFELGQRVSLTGGGVERSKGSNMREKLLDRIILTGLALLIMNPGTVALNAGQPVGGSDLANCLEKKLKDVTARRLEGDPSIVAPLTLQMVEVGTPQKITEFNGTDYFFRIPIIHRRSQRQVGFFDVEEGLDGNLEIVRRSGEKIANEKAIGKLPLDTLELTSKQVVTSAESKLGKGCAVVKHPHLVFDEAETRVGWAVTMRCEGKEKTVIVTPEFAYTVGQGQVTRRAGFRPE